MHAKTTTLHPISHKTPFQHENPRKHKPFFRGHNLQSKDSGNETEDGGRADSHGGSSVGGGGGDGSRGGGGSALEGGRGRGDDGAGRVGDAGDDTGLGPGGSSSTAGGTVTAVAVAAAGLAGGGTRGRVEVVLLDAGLGAVGVLLGLGLGAVTLGALGDALGGIVDRLVVGGRDLFVSVLEFPGLYKTVGEGSRLPFTPPLHSPLSWS